MSIIKQLETSHQVHLKGLITIPCVFSGTKKDQDIPKGYVVVVLDVVGPSNYLYCLEMGFALLPNTFQRLPTLGLLPFPYLSVNQLPGRMPIEIYSPPTIGGGVVHCLLFKFKSKYFILRSWQPSRTLEVYKSLDEDKIIINSNITDLDCSLVAYDPQLRDRQITVRLTHRGPENGGLRISSVTIDNKETVEDRTPEIFSSDQYQLNLTNGSTVLVSVRQLPLLPPTNEGSDFRYQIQIARSDPASN